MTCVKGLFRRVDYSLHRNLRNDDFDLDLWKQVDRLDWSTTVILVLTLLHSTTHRVDYSHTRNSDVVHCIFQGLELVLSCYDDNLVCRDIL